MNNEDNILVSILVPCYNHERYIGSCFESIINQTYDCIELFVCDDCSTDSSWGVISSFQETLSSRFNKVTISRNSSNIGVTKTLNSMLSQCNGSIIKLLASDDILHPDFCKIAVDNWVKQGHPEVQIFNGWYIDEDSTFYELKKKRRIYSSILDIDRDDLFEDIFNDNFICAPCTVISSEVYKRYGYYDENLMIEDWDFWLRLSKEKDVAFKFINEDIVYYRVNPESVTGFGGDDIDKKRLKYHQEQLKICQKHRRDIDANKYACRVLAIMVDEFCISNGRKLKNTKKVVWNELLRSDLWRLVNISFGIKAGRRIMISILKSAFR